jgi:predicted SpoU family rRNA methylase
MQEKVQEGAKKVFTNWGGDFFKKNLDFRANTNKILEKMQLTKAPEVGGPSGSAE